MSIKDYFVAEAEVIRDFFASVFAVAPLYVIDWVSPAVLVSGIFLGNFGLSLRAYLIAVDLA